MKAIHYSDLNYKTTTDQTASYRLLNNPIYKIVMTTIHALAIAIIFTSIYIVLASI